MIFSENRYPPAPHQVRGRLFRDHALTAILPLLRREQLDRVECESQILPEQSSIARGEEGAVVALEQAGQRVGIKVHGIDAVLGDVKRRIKLVDDEEGVPAIRADERISFLFCQLVHRQQRQAVDRRRAAARAPFRRCP